MSPYIDESYDILAEDEGVGHDGAEHEHDASQHPDCQSCGSLKTFLYYQERPGQIRYLHQVSIGQTTHTTQLQHNLPWISNSQTTIL